MMWCLRVYTMTTVACAFMAHLSTGEAKASETLSLSDVQFCQGGLEVMYPEIDISDCTIIPKGLREKISKEWGPPKVKMANAKTGSGLQAGTIKGTILSEYARPTPPQHSGLHRYQFMLFKQPRDQTLALSKEEMASLGNWEPQAFIGRFGLGRPVASVQFLTQNYKD